MGGRGERGRKREGVGGTQRDRWGIGHHKVSHARVRKDRAGATRGLRLGRPGHTLTVGRGAQGRAQGSDAPAPGRSRGRQNVLNRQLI